MSDYHHLSWDSNFFKFPIARIEPKKSSDLFDILKELKQQKYYLAYLFVDEKHDEMHAQALRENGILVDKKISFHTKPKNNKQNQITNNVRVNSCKEINNELIDLALLSGEYSRFKTDKNFEQGTFEQLYYTWLKNSIFGELSDYFITYHSKLLLQGFVTLKIHEDEAKIGLMSVAPTAQGKGIGTLLLNKVFQLCVERKINEIQVITQLDNIQACGFYKKNGFTKLKLEHVFHFWLSNNI